ncbi:MAG: hypothetical protein JSV96_06515 [Candidatus Aminicenantes bacterium]|nr:MAG: hypothetical protein JSV96_06515 [Candidatus Aminicenantes bacterium]
MIPNVIHFCFGLREDYGKMPFSFMHYLSVRTAYECNKPDEMMLYYKYEPKGEWWEKSRRYLTLEKIEPPTRIFGNPLCHFAHQLDVFRIDLLLKYGGIFLDMDVICLKSFRPLLKYEYVMGWEGDSGLCTAVLLSSPNSEFLKILREKYKNFRSKGQDEFWNENAVIWPKVVADQRPDLIHTVNKYAFFWPLSCSPHKIWGRHPKNTLDRVLNHFKDQFDYMILKRSFCIHLWESLWWDKYLKSLSPNYLQSKNNNFTRLFRKYIS